MKPGHRQCNSDMCVVMRRMCGVCVMCKHMCVFVDICAVCLFVSSIVLSHRLADILRERLSLNRELTDLARLTGQRAPHLQELPVLPSSARITGVHHYTQIFTWVLGICLDLVLP